VLVEGAFTLFSGIGIIAALPNEKEFGCKSNKQMYGNGFTKVS